MKNGERKIAILVDGDNAQPKLMGAILEEVAIYGKTTIRRVYGDWTQIQMNGWKDILNQHSLSPIQKFSYTTGKNSTDGALIIDAMDILHDKTVDGFCIVSSDSDYTGLAKRIREEGIFVMGIGEKKTPDAFIRSCEIFTYCENITPPAALSKPAKKTDSKQEIPVPVTLKPLEEHVIQKVDKAFEMSLNDNDRAHISTIGSNIRKIDPSFDPRAYGYSNMTSLVESIDKYEIVRNDTGHPIAKLK